MWLRCKRKSSDCRLCAFLMRNLFSFTSMLVTVLTTVLYWWHCVVLESTLGKNENLESFHLSWKRPIEVGIIPIQYSVIKNSPISFRTFHFKSFQLLVFSYCTFQLHVSQISVVNNISWPDSKYFDVNSIEHRHVLIAGICSKLTVVELRVLFREDQKVIILKSI